MTPQLARDGHGRAWARRIPTLLPDEYELACAVGLVRGELIVE